MNSKVICVHIGARAHYLLPKALHSRANLERLITDTWITSKSLRYILFKFPLRIVKSFSLRFSSSLPSNKVHSFSWKFLITEIYIRFKYKNSWRQTIARNNAFEKYAVSIFRKLPRDSNVLGISYTSLKVFEIAKIRNQKTILFQIDPGLVEEEIVANLVEEHKDIFATTWNRAPNSYWSNWVKECNLSDVIMVNSDWTSRALIANGISENKIKILPLPYSLETKHFQFKRKLTTAFDQKRPLRLLFLGTLTLRKGIHLVLDVASKLIDEPVEFIIVGHSELDQSLLDLPNVKYNGVASRSETDEFYKNADVFLFPTFSDGFGLTQLEAMAWNLPVIASKNCGEVVIDNYNGIVLPTCNVEELTKAIKKCLNNPEYLAALSVQGLETVKKFSIEQFAEGLSQL